MSYVFSERSLNNLRGVHKDLVTVCYKALEITKQDFTIIEGLRTQARQQELVRRGFSKTMRSRHLTGHAVDIVPFPISHHFDWPNHKWDAVAEAMLGAARDLGVDLEWGYAKWGWDKPHYQLSWDKYPR